MQSQEDIILPVDRIEFSVLGNNEFKRMTVVDKETVGIDVADLYDNMEPKRGGLIDPRMGSTDRYISCSTCGLNSDDCVGHFGHIDLAEPTFHMGYIQFVKKILGCICLKCSKLLVHKNENEIADMLKHKNGKARFKEIIRLSKNAKSCSKPGQGCGAPVTKIKLEIKKQNTSVELRSIIELKGGFDDGFMDGKRIIKQNLSPDIIYDILKNISDTDCLVMGIDPRKTRPEDMIIKVFPVPPVAIRPSAKVDSQSSSNREDDLTHKIADIIKANKRIRNSKRNNNDSRSRVNQADLLQYHIATYFDESIFATPKGEQRSRPFKSVVSRLKSKEGRIRGNLMGKRVEFSARTVITPDPTIDMNELGVPKSIAMNLTFPEVVTPHNRDHLQQLVRNGRHKYPGANFVFPANRRGGRIHQIDLQYRKDKIELKFGDIVERHIVSGDYVLLNRQPSLHKLSMMGHKIKVQDDIRLQTFRLCPAVTTPYNADFDGDEMNIFLPQSIQTQIELSDIADVKRQLISPRHSNPIIGVIQDGLLGSYNLTASDVKIEWRDAMNIISYTTFDDFEKIPKKGTIDGTQLYSLIIPPRINNNVAGLKVENGNIVSGQIKASHLKAEKPNSLIHNIWNEYGMEAAKDFLDNAQRMVNNFNMLNGFSVGIGNLQMPQEFFDERDKYFAAKILETDQLITEKENNPEMLDDDIFEENIRSKLDVIRTDISAQIGNTLDKSNNFHIMMSSGAKGSNINLGQMIGCVGQQIVEGKRIKKKINGRALPYFPQNDDRALSRGFIKQSFYEGSKAEGFIFGNMGSREGLIDTAIKSVTGDTPVVIMENGTTRYTMIGNWIDSVLDKHAESVQHYETMEMELLEMKHENENVYIPTTDADGNVSWGWIKNITRHDPGKELYKIVTQGGRDVIVTESKSLLIWDSVEKQFLAKSTPEVVVGDFVPVTLKLPLPESDSSNELLFDSSDKVIEVLKQKYIQKQSNIVEFSNTFERDQFGMLLSRVSVYCSFENNKVIVSGKHKNILEHILGFELVDEVVTEDPDEKNNCVLDKIISMEKIDVALYPKVYDLTVPSTINFGLANGLHVVDTAESGYIQRKLVKSLEDAMISYDMTVRNGNNKIIQFVYGGDGADTTKQTKIELNNMTLSNQELIDKFSFTKAEMSNFKNYSTKQNDEHIELLKQLRDIIRSTRMKSSMQYMVMKIDYMLPINIKLVISNIMNDNKMKKSNNSLQPEYVLEQIEKILSHDKTHIQCIVENNSKYIKIRDDNIVKLVFRCAMYEYLSPRIAIVEHGMTKDQFDSILDRIVQDYNKSIVEPGEMVGVIAAQSIGEPVTQLTLNSIDWEDKIVVMEGRKIIIEPIGKYIDRYVEKGKNVQFLGDNIEDEKSSVWYADTSKKNIKTVSIDKNGKLSWNKISGLSKHGVVNKDGSSDLVKITTRTGRSITATKAKSFLTCDIENNVIKPIRGDEITVGTYVPIAIDSKRIETHNEINLKNYMSPTKYCYGSELEKGRELRDIAKQNGTRVWFKNNHNIIFTTPYKHSDSLGVALDRQNYDINCIYPSKFHSNAQIPERISLNEEFGFFIGAYIAEGCVSPTQVIIANNDDIYLQKVRNLLDSWNVGHHTVKTEDKNEKGWTSTSLIIHSTILKDLLKQECGKGSKNKKFPSWIYGSPLAFITGVLDGYFSGDGTVLSERDFISTTTVSEVLIKDLQFMLTQLNISSKISKLKKQTTNNRGSKNILQTYCLTIRNDNIIKFGKILSFTCEGKQTKLNILCKNINRFSNGKMIHREKSDLTGFEDILFDDIVKIETVQPSHGWVYDFTVDNDKTFLTHSGIMMMDTFHSAGIGSAGTGSLGVPRVQELLHFSKSIKTPITKIYLLPEVNKNNVVVNRIANYAKYTTIAEIRDRVDIIYDPLPFKKGGYMETDNVHNPFYTMNPTRFSCQVNPSSLPWLMRITLSKEKLHNKNISLLYIKSKFCNYWEKRYKDTKGMKKEERVILEKISQIAVLSNSENSKTPIIHIRFDMSNYNFGTMIDFLDMFVDKFKLKGVDDINRIMGVNEEKNIVFDKETGAVKKETEYSITTDGINMTGIRYLHGVDPHRTICNDVVTMYNLFGIEAARAVLLKEISQVFNASGKFTNTSHLGILVDIMTNNGGLISVDRHGLGKLDTDPLARASFEKTVDQLIQAAVFGEVDHMNSVSSRIMAGLVIKGGTGLPEVHLDVDMLENSEYVENLDTKYTKTFKELKENPIFDDAIGSDSNEDSDEDDIGFLPDM